MLHVRNVPGSEPVLEGYPVVCRQVTTQDTAIDCGRRSRTTPQYARALKAGQISARAIAVPRDAVGDSECPPHHQLDLAEPRHIAFLRREPELWKDRRRTKYNAVSEF